MKIVVISGEDQKKARERYAQIISGVKKKNWEVVPYSRDLIVSTGLFMTDILYSLDGIKTASLDDFKWLSRNADKYDGSLLIYVDGKLPALVRKALPKSTEFETFDTPELIWKFLDSFYPGNAKEALELFEELINTEAFELISFMLGRHLRDLYWVTEGGKGMNLPGWRAGKLKAQAAKFTKVKLRDTIYAIADIDIKSKTSDFDSRLGMEMMIVEKL